MSSAPPASEAIARDATWLAQAIDPSAGLGRLVRMDEEAYRDAAFLDDRLFQEPQVFYDVPIGLLEEVAAMVDAPAPRWIFHIGHVGSTLVSRLLGELPDVLSVREPRLLRNLAEMPAFAHPAARLMARRFDPDQAVLVKVTSFVSEFAPALVKSGGSALFLLASPENYIASILAGENSVREAHALAPTRAARMRNRVALGPINSDADLVAAAWACEATALEAAAVELKDATILWCDFDVLLKNLGPGLVDVARRLELPNGDQAAGLAQHPLTQRYSKHTGYEYSAQLRRDLIDSASAQNRASIAAALEMLARAADKSPLLARALVRMGKR